MIILYFIFEELRKMDKGQDQTRAEETLDSQSTTKSTAASVSAQPRGVSDPTMLEHAVHVGFNAVTEDYVRNPQAVIEAVDFQEVPRAPVATVSVAQKAS
ncbi:hypothetical protein C2857_000945 [Epichloe festucae Fl1]|uniref:CRIB domain-containing protein n=1 Tax=Epichloe festucae (strain Fl1) TaxID=877507 RepID=A0A7S9KK62_EPIFF|nr:hypothetical protein C2857_000945 [Epichloe festucae Fl1]